MRRSQDPSLVVRLTLDRVVVHGASAPSRAALTVAIERAVRAEVAANPGLWTGAADGSATATLRQRANGGSSDSIAGALAGAVSLGLGRAK
jgi:hypothetical protein